MKRLKTDIPHFERRIKYRLRKSNARRKKFALQESVFRDGFFLMYDGKEFASFGDNQLYNQISIQNQLNQYLSNKVYQMKLPF